MRASIHHSSALNDVPTPSSLRHSGRSAPRPLGRSAPRHQRMPQLNYPESCHFAGAERAHQPEPPLLAVGIRLTFGHSRIDNATNSYTKVGSVQMARRKRRFSGGFMNSDDYSVQL